MLDGTVVTNQADLVDNSGAKIADSDDPTVNGIASPDIAGDDQHHDVVADGQIAVFGDFDLNVDDTRRLACGIENRV